MRNLDIMTLPTDETVDPFEVEPEALFGHAVKTRDVAHAVSRSRASRYDGWGAVHAQFASDTAAAQAVSLQQIGGASWQARRDFQEIGNALARAATAAFSNAAATRNGQQMIEQNRAGVLAVFNPQTADIIRETLAPTDHLAQVDPQRRDPASGTARLEGKTVTDYLAQCRAQAEQFAEQVGSCLFNNDRPSAVTYAYQSDLRAFEAYLLDAADATGDLALATVDLRWDMAVELLQSAPSLPDLVSLASRQTRALLYDILGPVEWPRVLRYLQRFPEVA